MLFDLASLTKILVSVPLMLKEFDKNELSLDTYLSEIYTDYNLNDKSNIRFDEMFSHQAALIPWIPFYKETLDSITKKQIKKYYKDSKSNKFSIQVADKLFMNKYWNDTIMKRLVDSELLKVKEYRYSDVPYYFLKSFLESKYGRSLDFIIKKEVFSKIRATSLTFNPRDHYPKYKIVPSEIDSYFRYNKLQGFVHDMGAAMQGGIGGHAGLFGNSEDIAKMMHLFLSKGKFGDIEIFSSSNFDLFNKRHFKGNRRGIGFDKRQLDKETNSACECVSDESFGHSGFTGTYAWADPEDNLIYVFLSNRTFPSMENKKLIKNNIRTEVHRLIKNSIN